MTRQYLCHRNEIRKKGLNYRNLELRRVGFGSGSGYTGSTQCLERQNKHPSLDARRRNKGKKLKKTKKMGSERIARTQLGH